MTEGLMVGAVAYDPKVVPIWEGIREYFRGAPVEMDFVLFSNYEAQVEALLAGKIDVAWNTNLAYVRVHHATAGECRVARDARYRRRVLHVARRPARRPRLDGGPARQDPGGRQRGFGAGDDHADPLPHARGSRASRRCPAGALRLRCRQARRHGPQRARRPRGGARRTSRRRRGGRRELGRLRPRRRGAARRGGAVLDLPAVLALQLHRDADPGSSRPRMPGPPTCERWIGRTRTIGGSSSSRGSASGSVRSSTGIATCSPPSRSRGSRWRGDRSRARRDLRRRGSRSRRRSGVRVGRVAVRRGRRRHDRDPQQERGARPRVAGVGARHRQRPGRARARGRRCDLSHPPRGTRRAAVPRPARARRRGTRSSRRIRHPRLAPRDGGRDPGPRGPGHRLRAPRSRGGARRPALPVHAHRARPRVGDQRRIALRPGDRAAVGREHGHPVGRVAPTCRTTWSGPSRR